MGRTAGWMKELTGRDAMRSPGAPSLRNETERLFWIQIATGVTSEKAAQVVGVSSAVGTRWFRHRGGMPLFMSNQLSRRYLSFAEREEIGLLRAQWKAERVAKRPKPAKLVTNPRLHHYVQDRLEGKVHDADGREIAGPRQAPFKGRNKPHRSDRKWVNGWSPEQISNRLHIDFLDDEFMRISHEAIYQALYIKDRGALKCELVSCLRTGRALRVPRARAQAKAWAHVSEVVMISNRPAEVKDRAVPGHWEGDLIIGLNRSAIGTLVERSTRFTMLVHLPREEGYGLTPRTKTVTDLPVELWRSLTWDRGRELSDHVRFTIESAVKVFFADPRSPWQRGTNENTNGLLRQYFPKGTDLSRWSAQEIQAVAHALNTRPRKTLGWKTPAEILNKRIKSIQQSSVATTG